MPDSWRITGNLYGVASPGATSLEIASYCLADQGIEFDAGALFQNSYVESPARDGGVLGFSRSGVRRFRFPLRLASTWPGPGGLNGIEDFLRRLVRTPNPGYIDLLPHGGEFGGNPSSAVRFDIIDGRVLPVYMVYHQRVGVRDVTLELDVQPFGYLPTMITLASAGVGTAYPYRLAFNPASIIGDVPGLAEINIAASVVGSEVVDAAAALSQDAIFWSLSTPSGATTVLVPSAWTVPTAGYHTLVGSTSLLAATHIPDTAAPYGVSLSVAVSPTAHAGQWEPLFIRSLNLYRGRYRMLAYMRIGAPSYGHPFQIVADENPGDAAMNSAMGSAYPVATLLPPIATSFLAATWANDSPSGMFQILDLGEHAFPPGPSGVGALADNFTIRIWGKAATSNMAVASPHLELGGVYLHPVDTCAGIVARGLIQPSLTNITATTPAGGVFGAWTGIKHMQVNAFRKMVMGVHFSSDVQPTVSGVTADLRQYHYGAMPEVATSVSLELLVAGRGFGNSGSIYGQMLHSHPFQAAASLRYQPRFSFLRGL